MGPNLTIVQEQSTEEQNYQIVTFKGEFDKAGFAEVKQNLDSIVEAFSKKSLIFDFSELNYINSEGIGYLMEIHTHFITRGRQLVVVGLKDNIKDIFSAIGIGEILPILADLKEFLNKNN